MTARSVLSLAACAMVVVAAADPARAQDDPAVKREAKAHFTRGKQLYQSGNYHGAIAEYEAAYQLIAVPELIFDIGQAHRLALEDREALAAYQRFLVLRRDAPLSREARQHVAALTERLAATTAPSTAAPSTAPATVAPQSASRDVAQTAPAQTSEPRARTPDEPRPNAAPPPPTAVPAISTPPRQETLHISTVDAGSTRSSTPSLATTSATDAVHSRKRRQWLWVGGAIIVAVGVGLGVGLGLGLHPQSIPSPTLGDIGPGAK